MACDTPKMAHTHARALACARTHTVPGPFGEFNKWKCCHGRRIAHRPLRGMSHLRPFLTEEEEEDFVCPAPQADEMRTDGVKGKGRQKLPRHHEP